MSNSIPINYYRTSDEILTTVFPEPDWVVPGLLPPGLAVLAGAPKFGKSWLALQISQAVAAGGYVLDQKVNQASVLYLALEDPLRRLQERMLKQGWSQGLPAEFLAIGDFHNAIGYLNSGGEKKLEAKISRGKSRLVVIDTFSRAVTGKQDDVQEMTKCLTPLQESAHQYSCTILIIDHHNKNGATNKDPILDILGSTAKGAMADTILGLYRERGKTGAILKVTGRDVDEQVLDLKMDWQTGVWQLDQSSQTLPPQQQTILSTLEQHEPASAEDLAKIIGINRGTIHNQLILIEGKRKVTQDSNSKWKVVRVNSAHATNATDATAVA